MRRPYSLSVGKDGCDVLTFTKQPNDIKVVVALEVEPEQWKLGYPPGPQSGNVQDLPQHWLRCLARLRSGQVLHWLRSPASPQPCCRLPCGSSGTRSAYRAVPGVEGPQASIDLAARDRQQFLVIRLGTGTSRPRRQPFLDLGCVGDHSVVLPPLSQRTRTWHR